MPPTRRSRSGRGAGRRATTVRSFRASFGPAGRLGRHAAWFDEWMPGRALDQRLAPAVGAERPARRLDPRHVAQPGHELAVGQGRRRFAGHLSFATVPPVPLPDLVLEPFAAGAR